MKLKTIYKSFFILVCLLGITFVGCIFLYWKSEIPMADGKNFVDIKQEAPNRLCLRIGPKDMEDRDIVILEDNTPNFSSFWLSLPRSDEKEIYILDPNYLVKDVKCKRFNIHVVREYVYDEKDKFKQWIDPQNDKNRDTYYIFPAYERIDKIDTN